MQWTLRCLGLKLFLSLAAVGWEGYVEVSSGTSSPWRTGCGWA